MGSQRVRHDWMTFTSLYFTMRTRDKETKTGNTVTRWSKSLEQRWGGPELGDGIEQGWRLLETCLTHCAVLSHSVMSDSLTPWTAAHQPPLFMGFFRQEYWNGLSCPPPGDLPDPGIEPRSPLLQADSLPSEPPRRLVHIRKLENFRTLSDNVTNLKLPRYEETQNMWNSVLADRASRNT